MIMPTENNSINLKETLKFTCIQKINRISLFSLRYYNLKKPAIWLAESILAHNLRTRILPDMRFVMKFK